MLFGQLKTYRYPASFAAGGSISVTLNNLNTATFDSATFVGIGRLSPVVFDGLGGGGGFGLENIEVTDASIPVPGTLALGLVPLVAQRRRRV